MKTQVCVLLFALVAALTVSVRQAEAANSAVTAVYCEEIHCESCARKIASKLFTVKGVLKVQASVEKSLILITPQNGKTLSPRALWIAVENGEATPVKLIGPSGSFESKPQA